MPSEEHAVILVVSVEASQVVTERCSARLTLDLDERKLTGARELKLEIDGFLSLAESPKPTPTTVGEDKIN